MKIGLYMKWNKGSLNSERGNVLGDELLGESICKSLLKDPRIKSAELYAPNFEPKEKLDYLIYLNDTAPLETFSRKHVLYLQNGYGEQAEKIVRHFNQYSLNGHIFFSQRLLDIHESLGNSGRFIPFGVDTDFFKPTEVRAEFEFDTSYVGNDIKGIERTLKYIYPATNYKFGLFGNWKVPKARFKVWKNWFQKVEPYQREFEEISRGKIPQENIPPLYSSSKVNLNCTLQACVDWDVITLRTFEILACGGFLISDKVPSAVKHLSDFVVFTEGGEDLKNKIEYYLSHPNERNEFSRHGVEYVKKHANIDARAREIINYLEEL